MSGKRLVKLKVDLAGSKLGPDFLSVDVEVAPPLEWTDDELRERAAAYYRVPVAQVGPVREIRRLVVA